MLQAAITDFLNQLVPKTHNITILSVKIYHLPYKLSQKKSVKASLRILFFYPRH